MSISTRHAVALLLAAIFLNGCSKSSGDADIRVLNASIDYSSLDLYLDNGTTNTREITGARSLHLDHSRPKIGELSRAERCGDRVLDRHDGDPV